MYSWHSLYHYITVYSHRSLPLLLLFLLFTGMSLTRGFLSLNEPLRDNCPSRVSANCHPCLLHVSQAPVSIHCQSFQPVEPNDRWVHKFQIKLFTWHPSNTNTALWHFPQSNKPRESNRNTLEMAYIQELNKASYFQLFYFTLLTQLFSKSKLWYLHYQNNYKKQSKSQGYSYWTQLSLSQSHTLLNWCSLYSMAVLGAKGKCVWLLRYGKVRIASMWRDPKGRLELRAHAVRSSILPVALTSTDDNGRPRGAVGKCCTCELSVGKRNEAWLHVQK